MNDRSTLLSELSRDEPDCLLAPHFSLKKESLLSDICKASHCAPRSSLVGPRGLSEVSVQWQFFSDVPHAPHGSPVSTYRASSGDKGSRSDAVLKAQVRRKILRFFGRRSLGRLDDGSVVLNSSASVASMRSLEPPTEATGRVPEIGSSQTNMCFI